jgi:transcriptional regulator with XRE-family HTH domain
MMVGVNPIDFQIGARVRALREQRGFTLGKLAEMIGADPSDLERYETGAAPAPVSLIVKLARVLDASAGALIDEDQGAWSEALDDLARAGPDGAVELVSALCAIPDGRVRRAFLDLAWSIVDAQSRPDAED